MIIASALWAKVHFRIQGYKQAGFNNSMWPLILVVIVSAVLMIGAYQIILHKYYRGPGRTRPGQKNKPRRDGNS